MNPPAHRRAGLLEWVAQNNPKQILFAAYIDNKQKGNML